MTRAMKWFPALPWCGRRLVVCAILLAIMMPFHRRAAGAVDAQTTAPAAAYLSGGTVRQNGLVRVEFLPGYETYAASIQAYAQAALRKVNEATGDALLVQITFVLASDEKQFLDLAGREGEQSLAVALGGKQTVVVSRPAMARSGADKIQQVLVHELTHIYLDTKCQGFVPRWLHEGVAQMVAGEWTDAAGDGTMTVAAYTGGLLPLRDLTSGFPVAGAQRQLAYAEAYSATRFLVREDHSGSLRHLITSIRGEDGRKYLDSLARGVELDSLDRRWRAELRSPGFALTLILGSGFFWGFAAVLLVVAWFVVRKRSKLIRRRWANEDAWAAEMGEPLDDGEWAWSEPETWRDQGDDDDDDDAGEEWKRGR